MGGTGDRWGGGGDEGIGGQVGGGVQGSQGGLGDR